ncbi:MAG TPA: GNAT family N-acetyltransferase [Lapillicoccus sp.]|uniref:GNAT family N-acetyltransferase n=1 Tax=Lapillicoccus sp. TaxID=1909287 RepID=UPI002F954D97
MTENPIRVSRTTDADRFLATDQTVWFQEVYPAPAEQQLVGLPEDQRFAADVDGADPATYPGVYGVFPMTLAVPGPDAGVRHVPCAALSWVGVHPDHRRRGVLSAMIRDHLERVHEEPGNHVSALHASEPAIYGRYGYGLASLELTVELSRHATLTAPGLDTAAAEVTSQFTTVTDPDVPTRMHNCHVRVAGLGAVVGDVAYYDRICYEPPEQLREKEAWRVLFARRDGEDIGFAVFRRSHKWEKYRPAGELAVWLLVGEPVAQLVLLRRLVDFDLMGTVKVGKVGADDPLVLWTGGPRSTSDVGTFDSLWVRIVDLPEALEARTWTQPCDVVLEVADVHAPWNDGRWRIHADASGQASVDATSADAEVTLPIQALGAAYLGGGNLAAQHRAGLVAEQRVGAVRELSQAMRTPLAPSAAMAF